jgi:hypothetical protein
VAHQGQHQQSLISEHPLEELIRSEAHVRKTRGAIGPRLDVEQRLRRQTVRKATQLSPCQWPLGHVHEGNFCAAFAEEAQRFLRGA